MAVDWGVDGFTKPGEPKIFYETGGTATVAPQDSVTGGGNVRWWKAVPTALAGFGNAVSAIFGGGNNGGSTTQAKIEQAQERNQELQGKLEDYKNYLIFGGLALGAYFLYENT